MHKIGISIFIIGAFVASSTAHAHGGHGVSFMAGMTHPLLGFDHLLAMLGMGVSVAALGVRARWFAVALVGMALFVGDRKSVV